MSDENIEFVVSLRGGSESAAEVSKVKEAIAEAGGATRTLGAESRAAAGGASNFAGGLKRMAAGLLAVGAGYKLYNAAKGAISYTKELAESSNALTKATGLTIEESSRYVGVAGALGVSSGQLNMAFKSLSTQTQKQADKTHVSADSASKHRLAVISQELALGALEKRMAKGTISQAEYALQLEKIKLNASKTEAVLTPTKTAFDKLGISQAWVAKHGKNFNDVILEVTKRLNEMKGSPEKTKIETELFGRSWAALNPLLGEGAAHLEHVLAVSKKFGVELKGGVNKELEELREAQLESTLASDGLRIAFTKTAAGPMINLLKGFARIKNFAREKNWGGFSKELDKVFTVAEHVVETFELRSIEGFGRIAPKMLNALWNGFKEASLPNKALLAGIIAAKFGLTGAIFGALGKGLTKRFGAGLIAEGGEVAIAGTALGVIFEGAFFVAVGAGIALGVKELSKHIQIHTDLNPLDWAKGKSPISISSDFGAGPKGQTAAMNAANAKAEAKNRREALAHPYKTAKAELAGPLGRPDPIVEHFHRKYGEVGSHSPKLLDQPHRAHVMSLAPGSLRDERPMYLQVDGKVLARVLRRQDLLGQAAGA